MGKITVLVVICCCALPAQAKYGGGTGGPNDPYLIYDANQMNTIGADQNDWDKHFKLCADIDLSGLTGTSFNIIGYYVTWGSPDNKPFTGVFDGNGHTISNFSYTSTDTDRIGLFGYVRGKNAEIKNLGLIDAYLNAGTGQRVGSLVGRLEDATITACYAQGASITGDRYIGGLVGNSYKGTIENCYSGASVHGGRYVGGLVGDNGGTITNCYSSGSVSGDWIVGGLVGRNNGTVINCYSSGSVSGADFGAGGLVGENGWKITNCYSSGSVMGMTAVGGLVGLNYAVTITNCYSSGSVSGTHDVGGLVGSGAEWRVANSFWDIQTSGQTASAGGTPKTTAEMQTANTFILWVCPPVWTIDEGLDYPRFWWESARGEAITLGLYLGGGNGEVNEPYLIYTAEQLNMIGLFQCIWDKHFKLMADIDLSEYTGKEFNIIGWYERESNKEPFTGIFDGNGWTIRNFTWRSSGICGIGIFSCISSEGHVKNLCIENANIDARESSVVGVLSGVNAGTISNCLATGSVTGGGTIGGLVAVNDHGTILNSYTRVIVVGKIIYHHGGLVGVNSGTIFGSYATEDVTGDSCVGGLVGSNSSTGTISNCYATGVVTGDENIGGLIGSNSGSIFQCYAGGDVLIIGDRVGGLVGSNRGLISDCHAKGNVFGGDFRSGQIGGLVGRNDNGEISHSYAEGMVTTEGDGVGGLVGCNDDGIISCCFATSSVFAGDLSEVVGGLVGSNFSNSLISESFASGDVSGNTYVGGLVGYTKGTNAIANCWAGGNISGDENVGGLVGYNRFHYGSTSIYHCYAVGSVPATGTSIGGLVGGGSSSGSSSFWDMYTSGTTYSKSGTGKTTAEMQTMSTFMDAGWDFVGETANGTDDTWFIPQGDYPHLWWEEMQVPMKLTPRTLNCRSKGTWVKAHLTLPQGFTVADVDSNRPAVLHSFGFESAPLYVFVNKDKLVEIEAAFEREAVCSLAGDWPQALTVAGFLTDGSIFLGTSTVRIIHPGLNVIEELASCWLQADCVHPTWCDRIDMNRDSLVNLLDYALLMNINVEFVSDE